MLWRFLALGMIALAATTPAMALSGPYTGKKVIFVDSYHEGYQWSDDITRAVSSVIGRSGAELKIVRMDTKHRPEEDYKVAKGREVADLIKAERPDVVIACDDNAAKYVIAPYIKDSEIPVVFCGINDAASKYGFPARNVTGILEITSFNHLGQVLKAAGGDISRIGILTVDNESDRADKLGAKNALGVAFSHERNVKTFDEWKKAYTELQSKVDLLILYNNVGIVGWNDEEAAAFVATHTSTLTATIANWMTRFAAFAFSKTGTEQGRLAADMALKVLAGTSPADIPIGRNREDMLVINAKVAALSRLKIPPVYFRAAAQVIE